MRVLPTSMSRTVTTPNLHGSPTRALTHPHRNISRNKLSEPLLQRLHQQGAMEIDSAGEPLDHIARGTLHIHHPPLQGIRIAPVLQERPQSLSLEVQQPTHTGID